ncbi:MAG: hypothetical protein ACKO5Y_02775 [Bacteroidota bacterium]
MKIKLFLILMCSMQLAAAFSQRDSLYEWREIQHNVQNLTVHYQLRPKIPFFKKGEHRIFMKLENKSGKNLPVHIQLYISSAEMVSDQSIYSAFIEIKSNERKIGRRGGVVFNPKKFRPFIQEQEIHFDIQEDAKSSIQ